MRKLYELDGADDTGILVVGETLEGDDRISLTLTDRQNNSIRVFLDEQSFKELCDLRYTFRYRIDVPAKPLPFRIATE